MRGIEEFKGYRTMIEFDETSGAFCFRRIDCHGFLCAEKLSRAANLNPCDGKPWQSQGSYSRKL